MSEATSSTLPDGQGCIHLGVVLYSSAEDHPYDDVCYRDDRRPVEIEFRLMMPTLDMPLQYIRQYATEFNNQYYPSITRTKKWCCAFCGAFSLSLVLCPVSRRALTRARRVDKSVRMSQQDMMPWTLASPPRVLVYACL